MVLGFLQIPSSNIQFCTVTDDFISIIANAIWILIAYFTSLNDVFEFLYEFTIT